MNALATIERYDEKMAALWAHCCEWNDTVAEGSQVVVVAGGIPQVTTTRGPATVLPSGQIGVMVDCCADYVAIDSIQIVELE